MKFLLFAALVVAATAHLVPVSLYGKAEDRIDGEYMVQFAQEARAEFEAFKTFRAKSFAHVQIHEFSNYMGFWAVLSEDELFEVQQMQGVKTIEPNSFVYAMGEQNNVEAWGIDRSDQRALPLNSVYRWSDNADGSGIGVFILDTGILSTHTDFGGRAEFVADCAGIFGTCSGTQQGDPQGHGTHCAGSVGSNTYGIAKNASLYNVRVLNSIGSGSINGIVNGIQVVVNRATPAVRIISMSLGGGFASALDAAVDAAYDAGVLSVVAAGNSNNNGCTGSPAGASRAFTVSASDINDAKASFSSFGTCVDIWAPGVNILSTSNSGGTAIFSGTSMSTPHVAGAAALIASRGVSSPAEIAATLIAESTLDVISGAPAGTPNRLLFTNPQ